MKKANFNDTVDILVKAYLNGTLEHGNCYACAVGNLVVASNGYTYTKCWDRPSKRLALKENSNGSYFNGNLGAEWYNLIDTIETPNSLQGIKEIESTGYTIEEVVKIESAFEGADNNGDWMFNGLMAVVDVLADIHRIDLKVKEEAKLLFVK